MTWRQAEQQLLTFFRPSLVIVFSLVFLYQPSGPSAQSTALESSQNHVEKGKQLYQEGNLREAAAHWTEAARLYEQTGEKVQQSQALLYLAQALQDMGQTLRAAHALEHAQTLATEEKAWLLVAHILDRLGTVYLRLGKEKQSLGALNEGLKLARTQGDSVLGAVLLNDIGNTWEALDRQAYALGAYAESAILAKNTGNPTLATIAEVNAAMSEMNQGFYENAQERLDLASLDIQHLPDSHDKANSLLKIGLAYHELRHRLLPEKDERISGTRADQELLSGQRGISIQPLERKPESSEFPESLEMSPKEGAPTTQASISEKMDPPALLKKASEAFYQAIKLANQLHDPLSESYGWGYLGQLYEEEARWEEALYLTRRAIRAIRHTEAPEALYRWYWQLAQGHRALGNFDKARHGYQWAIGTLNPIRFEFMAGFAGKKRPFRQTIGGLYYEYADLLLQKAASIPASSAKKEYLLEARETVEALKAAELQDYFQDQCVEVARRHGMELDQVSNNTVVLYPISLPDRLELLVSLPSGLEQIVVPVSEPLLRQEIRLLRETVEAPGKQDYLPHAQKLYDWLIRPIGEKFKEQKAPLTTIVFVPDGALGTIPLAALHDGQDFLITHYAVATTPGLILTDMRPLDRQNIKLLALGVTKETQGFPPLPNVQQELLALKNLYGGKILLNEQFNVKNMERELKTKEFNVVHIASHGLFDRSAQKTFVLAYDEKITLDKLSDVIGVFKFGAKPLGLLTLSACQTAVGDDRAVLGLAGIAIKAGAQSALATLWFIDDQVTSQLIPEFYRQIHDHPSMSKAVALQKAQLKFLNNPLFSHPSYWAPFLLINNWL